MAALPGLSAIFLRVYENALVRRTEAELIAQSAALAAAAAINWLGGDMSAVSSGQASGDPTILPVFQYQPTEVDLRSSPILPPRPRATPSAAKPDTDALAATNHMRPAFLETRMATLSSIIMLDDHGTVLTGPDVGMSLAGLPELSSALDGKPATVLRTNAGSETYNPFE